MSFSRRERAGGGGWKQPARLASETVGWPSEIFRPARLSGGYVQSGTTMIAAKVQTMPSKT